MRLFERNKTKSTFAGDVLKLVSGTAFAQSLTILASPLLTRLYEPEAFGSLALFISIIGIISVISCLRYELSIVLPKSDQEAANLLGLSCCFVMLITSITIPIVWITQEFILNDVEVSVLNPYLWLIPPAVFFGGIFQALNYWNTRTKHFSRLSFVRVFQSLVVIGLQLGVGTIGYASGGSLISSIVVGSALSTLILGAKIWHDDKIFFKDSLSLSGLTAGLNRYRKFPLYQTWGGLLNSISWQLPSFMLYVYFSPAIVGYYALSNRLLRIPMNLIGESIRQVFLQRASDAKNEAKLAALVESVYEQLVSITMLPSLLLLIVGQDIFVFVFGNQWDEAGIYTQILALWTLVWFISSPLATIFNICEKQEVSLRIHFLIFVTRIISLAIGGECNNPRLAILLFASSGILVYGYLIFKILNQVGVSLITTIGFMLKYIFLSMPSVVIVFSLKNIGTNIYLIIITCCFSLFVYYYLILKNKISLLKNT